MNQFQIYYNEGRKMAELDVLFLQMAGLMPYEDGTIEKNPTTKKELALLIKKRPAIYSKYAGYIDQLSD